MDEIKDMTNEYVIDGDINEELLKKNYPREFANEILKRIAVEAVMGQMGANYPFELKKVVKDDEHTLVLITSQYVLRFVWIEDYQKTMISLIPIDTARFIKKWI